MNLLIGIILGIIFSYYLISIYLKRRKKLKAIRMVKAESVKKEISELEKNRWNNYEPRGYRQIRSLNSLIRTVSGDEEYLKYLRRLDAEIPRPEYKVPDEISKIMLPKEFGKDSISK